MLQILKLVQVLRQLGARRVDKRRHLQISRNNVVRHFHIGVADVVRCLESVVAGDVVLRTYTLKLPHPELVPADVEH